MGYSLKIGEGIISYAKEYDEYSSDVKLEKMKQASPLYLLWEKKPTFANRPIKIMIYNNSLKEINLAVLIAILSLWILLFKAQNPILCMVLHCLFIGGAFYIILKPTKDAKYLVPLLYFMLIYLGN